MTDKERNFRETLYSLRNMATGLLGGVAILAGTGSFGIFVVWALSWVATSLPWPSGM